MRILVSIDDTDNLDSRGTGALASELAEAVETSGWGKSGFVTRHQLYVHPDIPYTSHNSAMCFPADIDDAALPQVIGHASAYLARESAAGSDPGLCVVAVERLADPQALIAFGRRAKGEIISMEEACALARGPGIHLSPHGGTGQGIIGALAGAGLRLSGCDGRMKGHLVIAPSGGIVTAAQLAAHPDVDEVRTLDGVVLRGDEPVKLGDKVKTVMLEGKAVLLVTRVESAAGEASWQNCPRQLLKRY